MCVCVFYRETEKEERGSWRDSRLRRTEMSGKPGFRGSRENWGLSWGEEAEAA